MDALYLYLELVALAVLVWLCRDKFKPLAAKPLAETRRPRGATKPVFMFRPQRAHAPGRSRPLRRNRSSLAR
ncbi:hypothetical protein NOV72_00703 [Caballeronia novacaledonica]|uniref:Uncharacterized protein n=1 Tax=Caballeronia novacaledonica TaxID=1544861 RepID=A0A2U3I016_9BURK|nr:hypothetical protein [Caballeronia novacaledonica]SPB13405.1 hypothetical protein NOV72_00703 [Caballeronia novacaledonica]